MGQVLGARGIRLSLSERRAMRDPVKIWNNFNAASRASGNQELLKAILDRAARW